MQVVHEKNLHLDGELSQQRGLVRLSGERLHVCEEMLTIACTASVSPRTQEICPTLLVKLGGRLHVLRGNADHRYLRLHGVGEPTHARDLPTLLVRLCRGRSEHNSLLPWQLAWRLTPISRVGRW